MARACRFAPGNIRYRLQQEGALRAPSNRLRPAAPIIGNLHRRPTAASCAVSR